MKRKFKSLIAFFLALICITGITPTTVFGATVSNISLDWFTVNGKSYDNPVNSSVYPGYKQCLVNNFSDTLKEFTIEYWDYEDGYDYKVSKGDIIHLTLYTLPNSRYLDFTPKVYFYCEDTSGKPFGIYSIGTYTRSTGLISFDLKVVKDVSKMYLWYIHFSDIKLTGTQSNFGFVFKDVSVQTETAETGFRNSVTSFFSDLFGRLTEWFNNLFQWLKDIRDGNISFSESVKTLFSNITNNIRQFFSELGTKLSDGFSNLVNNISNFFTNLTNNLKQWFENIGKWFTDLWDNITGTVTDITTDIHDWWQSVCDWFKSLVTVDENYFDDYKNKWQQFFATHFGFAWESIELFSNIIGLLSDAFNGSYSSDSVIVIPEVKLPFYDAVLIPQTEFDFDSLVSSHEYLYAFYTSFKLLSSSIFIFATAFFGYSTIRKILGMNGGND